MGSCIRESIDRFGKYLSTFLSPFIQAAAASLFRIISLDMGDLNPLSPHFSCSKEHAKRTVFRHYPCCSPHSHNDRHRKQVGSSPIPINRLSAHYPLTSRSPSQLQDIIKSTKRSYYQPRTKEIIDRPYILRPVPLSSPASPNLSSVNTAHSVPQAPHLRSISRSHPKPRPISLFPLPLSESSLHSPLTPLFHSSTRLSTSRDILPRSDSRTTHDQSLSRSIEKTIGLPPKYTLQLNLPGDCSSFLVLSDYDFGFSDTDTEIGKVDDQIYPSTSFAVSHSAPPTRKGSKDARSNRIEKSSSYASQEQNPPPGQRLSSSYFDFDTDSSESDATQVVLLHRRLTPSTETSKKRTDRPSTSRVIHSPAKSSRNSTRSPHHLKRSNSRPLRNSPSLHLKVSTQRPHSCHCSQHSQNNVASILDSLSPARAVVPQPQKHCRHRQLTPALATLTPPSLFAPSSTKSRNSASSAKKKFSIPPSPTSPSGVSIKVDISKVMSHTMYAPSNIQPSVDFESSPVGFTVNDILFNGVADQKAHAPLAAADHWPHTPFADMFQDERLALAYLSPEGIVHGINVVRKSERRQGWSGEWNQPRIEDVIQKLRTIWIFFKLLFCILSSALSFFGLRLWFFSKNCRIWTFDTRVMM